MLQHGVENVGVQLASEPVLRFKQLWGVSHALLQGSRLNWAGGWAGPSHHTQYHSGVKMRFCVSCGTQSPSWYS